MQVIHLKRPVVPLVVVIKEVDDGWIARCNNIPDLLVFGKDYEVVRTEAMAKARKALPFKRFKSCPVKKDRQRPKKLGPAGSEVSATPRTPLLPLAESRMKDRYHTREVDGLTRYVVNGRFLTIPQFIIAAGLEA